MSEVKYGLNLVGKIRVFRKDKEIQGKGKKKFDITDVWFNVSEKEENGEYINRSQNLLFKKDLQKPQNNTVITILDAFPVLTGDGDYRKIAWMVTSWEEAEQGKK